MHSAISAAETCPRLWHVHCTRSMTEPAYTRNRAIVVRSPPSPTHLSFDGRFSHEIRLAGSTSVFVLRLFPKRTGTGRPSSHPSNTARAPGNSEHWFQPVCPGLVLSISVRLSVCLSATVTRRHCVKTTARSTVQFALSDSKMCLVF